MTATPEPRALHRPTRRVGLDLRDERGSLPMLMMVMLVGVVLSTFMVSVVISQTTSTRFTTSREQALNAAQAGLDVALAQIRTATASGAGTLTTLPCWTHRNGAAHSGSVVSDPSGTQVGSGSYSVFVDYYMSDPVVGHQDPVASPNATMVCAPGYGTFDPVSGKGAPIFALITSTGNVAAGGASGTTSGRTLVSTYVFRLDNRNISGGIMRLYPQGANPPVCMESATAVPDPDTTPATAVVLANCSTSTPPSPRQVFGYRTDLTIQLISSVTEKNPAGVCLDAGKPPGNGNDVTLRQCAPLIATDPVNTLSWWQQWSFDDNGHLRGSDFNTRTSGALSGVCIAAQTQTVGQVLRAASCTGGTTDPQQAWVSSPDVGAGAATTPRVDGSEYVNFNEFGRCMDVTGQQTNATHLIAYFCKQNPSRAAGTVTWNQMFTYTPVTSTNYGQLKTVTGGTTYCVTSPGTRGAYPVLQPCTNTDPVATQQRWISSGSAGLTYAAKFTLVDSADSCLGLTTALPDNPLVSVLDTETCDGSRDQKWNATSNLSDTTLQNTIEK